MDKHRVVVTKSQQIEVFKKGEGEYGNSMISGILIISFSVPSFL